MMSTKSRFILSVVFALSFPICANSAWPVLAWELFVGTVSGAAGNILASAVAPSIGEEQTAELRDKVSRLEGQLKEFDIDGKRPDNFYQVQQTIFSLRNIVSSLDKRVTTLEDKFDNLEARLLAMENNVPRIEKFIAPRDKQRLLHLAKPSFNCSKAKKDIEISICQSLVLRDIDGRMGRIYWELRRYFPDSKSKELRLDQLRWLRKRDGTCYAYDEPCLVRMYKERIAELKAII